MSSKIIETVSEDAFSIPQWLDKEFLEQHLQNYFKNKEIQVINFDVKPVVGKGENYFSCIYRVNVSFSFTTKKDDVSKVYQIKSKLLLLVFFYLN